MDHRYLAESKKWWEKIDYHNMTATMIRYGEDEEGEFTETVVIPVKFIVCPTCEGKGTYVNPNVDSHGISAEDFENDPEFWEAYRSGAYDVVCKRCNGMRVIPCPVHEEHSKWVENRIRFAEYIQLEMDAERRMGA